MTAPAAALSSVPPRVAAYSWLGGTDLQAFRDHLVRLDPVSRRDRFGGGVSDAFLDAYAGRCLSAGAHVAACLVDGRAVGVGELHAFDGTGEAAFSVEPAWRRIGIGRVLMGMLQERAGTLGLRSFQVATRPDNAAMQALATGQGRRLRTCAGEARFEVSSTPPCGGEHPCDSVVAAPAASKGAPMTGAPVLHAMPGLRPPPGPPRMIR